MAKKTELSAKAKEVLDFVRENPGATFADMKEKGLEGVNPAHLRALNVRGLVSAEQVERETMRPVKVKVNSYTAVDVEEDE